MSAASTTISTARETAHGKRYVVIAVEAREEDSPVVRASRGRLLDAFAAMFREYDRETVGPFEIEDVTDLRILRAMESFLADGDAIVGPESGAYAAARAALGDGEALAQLAERQTAYGRELYALGSESAPAAPGSLAGTVGPVEEL